MKFCISVIFSSIFLTVSVLANGDILFCADSSCGGAKAFSVDNGCSFTVYTDPNCPNGATAVDLLDCKPGNWRSFSYDCQNVDLKA
ncbi:hypothetical protein V8E54_005348 [Elaphomyces granulatus]